MTSFVHNRESIYSLRVGDSVALGDVKYSIIKMMQGGMGRVFLMERSPESDRGAACLIYRIRLAVKIILPGNLDDVSREMFRRELAIWAGFRHPNILPLNEILDGNGEGWIAVMEWCPGTLRDQLTGGINFLVPEAIDVIRDVLSGLAYAYDSDGVLHLDLKPENILFNVAASRKGTKNKFMISDWGTASVKQAKLKKVIESPKLDEKHETFNNIGTLLYMSPERFQKGYPSSVASDVFSLGMILFELATGELPFSNERHPVQQIITGEYYQKAAKELVRQKIPAAFQNIILRWLAPDPADRPLSHRECIDAVNRLR